MSLTLGGSSSIVAHNLASLGSRVGFISCIGKDQLGEIALARLAESGVNVEKVRRADSGLSTGITVILQRDKWRNMRAGAAHAQCCCLLLAHLKQQVVFEVHREFGGPFICRHAAVVLTS